VIISPVHYHKLLDLTGWTFKITIHLQNGLYFHEDALSRFINAIFVTTSAFAHTSISGGINAAESTNLGFWGINPSFGIQHELTSSFYANLNVMDFSILHEANITRNSVKRPTTETF